MMVMKFAIAEKSEIHFKLLSYQVEYLSQFKIQHLKVTLHLSLPVRLVIPKLFQMTNVDALS